jgi:glycosyltransferase involved in cell wall biosynthesis
MPRPAVPCVSKQAPVGPITLSKLSDAPLVSIIIPSFNQGRFIRATLDSILSQDYRPLQIVVVDGGSQDETVGILQSYDVPELEWISEPDNGVVDAVNKGFVRIHGEIAAIQSSDDCYLPGAIRTAVDEFRSDSSLGLLYGDTVKVDAEGQELSRSVIGPYSLQNLFRIQTWIPQPSAFFRSQLLDVVGGWDDRIPYAPDTDLWIRIAFRSRVKKLDRFLSSRRLHDKQRDKLSARIAHDFARMIEQSQDIAEAPLELRRAAHAGKYLMRVRYNPYKSDLYAAWNLMMAGWCDSKCLDIGRIVNHLTWLPLRRGLSRLKRSVVLHQTTVSGGVDNQ